jgi:hypothetical protein
VLDQKQRTVEPKLLTHRQSSLPACVRLCIDRHAKAPRFLGCDFIICPIVDFNGAFRGFCLICDTLHTRNREGDDSVSNAVVIGESHALIVNVVNLPHLPFTIVGVNVEFCLAHRFLVVASNLEGLFKGNLFKHGVGSKEICRIVEVLERRR